MLLTLPLHCPLTVAFDIVVASVAAVDIASREKFKSKNPKRIAFVISAGILLALQETGQSGNIKTVIQMLLMVAVVFLIYDGQKRLKAAFVVIYSLFVALSKLVSYFAFSLFIDEIFERIPYLEKEINDLFNFQLLYDGIFISVFVNVVVIVPSSLYPCTCKFLFSLLYAARELQSCYS